MNDKKDFLTLLAKHIANTLTPEEERELFLKINSGKYDDLIYEDIFQKFTKSDLPGQGMNDDKIESIILEILSVDRFRPIKLNRWLSARRMVGVAAAILVLLTVSYLLIDTKNSNSAEINLLSTSNVSIRENRTQKMLDVKLEDQTIITLHPGAIIQFPQHFASDKREVQLTGEAFFKVSKNRLHPFYVYHDNLVTHVLGTSFNIKPKNRNSLVVVEVVTGRVEVYESNKVSNKEKPRDNGVVLYPNQKVTYNAKTGKFDETLVAQPVLAASHAQNNTNAFAFNDTSLDTIFDVLEKAYEIEIDVDNANINKCHFTGDITEQNLYKKLDAVCQSVNATYEIKGTKLIIHGKGCN